MKHNPYNYISSSTVRAKFADGRLVQLFPDLAF